MKYIVEVEKNLHISTEIIVEANSHLQAMAIANKEATDSFEFGLEDVDSFDVHIGEVEIYDITLDDIEIPHTLDGNIDDLLK